MNKRNDLTNYKSNHKLKGKNKSTDKKLMYAKEKFKPFKE